jgi:hypothetical protein
VISVSIVIPVRNGEEFIVEAIGSALAQGPLVGEVIVVDDGSTDGTIAAVRSIADPRLRLLPRPKGREGVSAVRNFGFSNVRGRWTMFLDADDRLREGAITTLWSAAGSTDAGAVYGDYERIDETGAKIGYRNLIHNRTKPSGHVLENMLGSNFIVNGGIMLVRTASFRAIGGFDDTLRYAEDWHGWCKLAATGPILHVSGAHVLDYRVHTQSVMMSRPLSFLDCLPAIDAVFSDIRIRQAVSPQRLLQLRRRAEAHMNAYAIGQAIRARRYGRALAALTDTIVHRPRQGAHAVLLSAAALAGI